VTANADVSRVVQQRSDPLDCKLLGSFDVHLQEVDALNAQFRRKSIDSTGGNFDDIAPRLEHCVA
jgi:hypothetical protein